MHLNVKSEPTRPNIPCDLEAFQLNPSNQSTPTNVDVMILAFLMEFFQTKDETIEEKFQKKYNEAKKMYNVTFSHLL